MKVERFNEIIEKRLSFCHSLLIPKGEEYSRNGDRLWNFKVASWMSVTGESPEQALLGMWRKHLVSVLDMIDDVSQYAILPTPERLAEKIGDTINYALLLEALFEERRDEGQG